MEKSKELIIFKKQVYLSCETSCSSQSYSFYSNLAGNHFEYCHLLLPETLICLGVVGTGKTILYEISDNTNQAAGMSAIAIAWGSGVILGPLISGK